MAYIKPGYLVMYKDYFVIRIGKEEVIIRDSVISIRKVYLFTLA